MGETPVRVATIPMPDRSVAPEDLWFVAQRLARASDELDAPVPYSWVIGYVQAALGSDDAPSARGAA